MAWSIKQWILSGYYQLKVDVVINVEHRGMNEQTLRALAPFVKAIWCHRE